MIKLPQNKTWAQTSDRDVFDPTLFGSLFATKNIDLTELPGKILLGTRMVLNTSTDDVASLTSYPVAFNLCGSNVHAQAGVSDVGYNFYNDGTHTGAFQKDTSTNITYSQTTGSGLNDLTVPTPSAGTQGADHVYLVQITTTGTPDKFTWTIDGGGGASGVNITGGNQTLSNGVVIKFAATTGHTNGDVWTVTLNSSPTTIDSTTSDATFSNNAMYVSATDPGASSFVRIYKKVGAQPFTSFSTTALSGFPHMLCGWQGRTYMTDTQSKVISWNSSDSIAYSGANTITLNGISGDFGNVITKLVPASDCIWILTVNTTGGKGWVYRWDGATTTYQAKYRLTSSGALAGVIKDDVLYITDTNGDVRAWNGGTFKKVGGVNRTSKKFLHNPISLVNNRLVHPNGMSIIEDQVCAFIDSRNYDSTGSVEETIPAGVYEQSDSQGLINKRSLTLTKSGATVIDYGASRIAGAGAMSEISLPSTSSTRNGNFFIGAKYYSDATSTKSGIFYDDTNDSIQKAGSFVTLKFQANQVKDAFKALETVYEKLQNSTDKFVIKCRTAEVAPVEGTITWTSTTTFTVPNSSVVVSDYWTSGTGGEVEIMQGLGAGKCAHITNAELSAGTWTVTVDETFTSATGTSKARFQKWNKLSVADFSHGETSIRASIREEGKYTWIQYKVWALWTGKNRIEKLIIPNTTMQPGF